jgi:hypothetical protein
LFFSLQLFSQSTTGWPCYNATTAPAPSFSEEPTLCMQYSNGSFPIVLGTQIQSTSQISAGSYTGQNIVVDGNFTINTSFAFYNCTIKFMQGSSFTVTNVGNCRVLYSRLFACEKMWEGIITTSQSSKIEVYQSRIEDAMTAINANDGGEIRISYSTLNRDNIGVSLNNNAQLLYYAANTISCTSPLNDIGGITKIGIKGFYIPFIPVGDNNTPRNYFIGLETGIKSYNSKLVINNFFFKDITYAIDLVGTNSILDADNALNDGFENCVRGVNAKATGNINIKSTNFLYCTFYAINLDGNCVGNVVIDNCVMEQAGNTPTNTVINLDMNTSGFVSIKNNFFSIEGDNAIGINITANFVANFTNINTNTANTNLNSIFVSAESSKSDNIRIANNLIGNDGAECGITFFNIQGKGNVIVNNNFSGGTLQINNAAIDIANSKGVGVCGNKVDPSHYIGIGYGYSCFGSNISNNELFAYSWGLKLRGPNIAISPQKHKYNVWEHDYNDLNPFGSASATIGLSSTDPNLQTYLDNNQFIVDFSKMPSYGLFNPNNPDPSTGWFIPEVDNNEVKGCRFISPQATENEVDTEVLHDELDQRIATGEYRSKIINNDLMAWEADYYLAQKLVDFPTLKQIDKFNAFDANLSGSLKSLMALRQSFIEANSMTASQKEKSKTLQSQFDLLKSSLTAIDVEISNSSEPSVLFAQKKQILDDATYLNTQINGLNNELLEAKLSRMTITQNVANNFSSTNKFETNLAKLYKLSIKIVLQGKDALTAEDANAVLQLATSAYEQEGPAVFIAQSMYTCNPSLNLGKSQLVSTNKKEVESIEKLKLANNLNFNISLVKYDETIEMNNIPTNSDVLVSNIMGQVIYTEKTANSYPLMLNTCKWGNGLFFICILNNNQKIFNQKINFLK